MKDLVTQGHDAIIMASNASEQHLLEFSSLRPVTYWITNLLITYLKV